jgi:hypothetical protein
LRASANRRASTATAFKKDPQAGPLETEDINNSSALKRAAYATIIRQAGLTGQVRP